MSPTDTLAVNTIAAPGPDTGPGYEGDARARAFDKAVSRVGNRTMKVSLVVPDIRCAACAWRIENGLRDVPAIRSVKTNLADKRVVVEYDPGESVLGVVQRIESLGYTPRPDVVDELVEALKSERRSLLSRLGVAGIGTMQVMMFAFASYVSGPGGLDEAYEALFRWASLALATPVAFYSASVFHTGALRDIRHGVPGMDVPVSLAIMAAWSLSFYNTLSGGEEVYFDSVCMFTFFLLVGRYIESGTRIQFQRSRDLTEHLVPGLARTEGRDGPLVPVEELDVGSHVLILPGERIPVDGVVRNGRSTVDESAFTGEVLPLEKGPGSHVLAGSLNVDGELTVEMNIPRSGFVIEKISTLYRESTLYKPSFTVLADRIARVFVSFVLVLAAGSGIFWFYQGSGAWITIALTVLVVSCPCALSLATPVAYTVATTALRRIGVVIGNGAFVERLVDTDVVAFDKTGTLTRGRLRIVEVKLVGDIGEPRAREIAASLEMVSRHPVALAFGQGSLEVSEAELRPGQGAGGSIGGVGYRLGKPGYVLGEDMAPPDPDGMWILLGSDRPLAWFRLEDQQRPEAMDTVKELKSMGYETVMLTGDPSGEGARLGSRLGIEQVFPGLSPEDKVAQISRLQREGRHVLMVGDGINDAAAMGIADVSVAVSPVDTFVQSSADATLLADDLRVLTRTVRYAVKVRRIIGENILWAITYNLCAIPLAITGLVEPWMAALGMSLSSVLVVLNSRRLGRVATWK